MPAGLLCFRYQSNNRYKLVKDLNVKETQNITTFSSINSFYSCIFSIEKLSRRIIDVV